MPSDPKRHRNSVAETFKPIRRRLSSIARGVGVAGAGAGCRAGLLRSNSGTVLEKAAASAGNEMRRAACSTPRPLGKLKVQGVAVHVGRAAPWRLEDHSRISRSSPVRAPLEQVKIEGEASVMLQPKLQWAMQTSLWAWRYSESIIGVRGIPN